MKKLQNNFTTPEQSKRLLELGVPVDSADCAYRLGIDEFIKILIPIPKDTTYTAFADSIFRVLEDRCLPCWSVGRLMEIFEICDVVPVGTNNMCSIPSLKRMSYIEYMMKCFTKAIEMKILDFSKLEE